MSRATLVFLMLLLMTLLSGLAWSAGMVTTGLDWSLPQLNNEEKQLQIRFSTQPEPTEKVGTQEAGSVVITSAPYQEIVVCAQDVEMASGTSDSLPLVALAENIWLLVTQKERTCLKLIGAKSCSPLLKAQHVHSSRQILLSNQSFLAHYHKGDKAKQYCLTDRAFDDNGSVLTGFPALEPATTVTMGGGYGPDFDPQNKRPPWVLFPASNAFSLTLLPNLRLPEGLGDYLPDLRTWYYLLDHIAHNEGQTLLLRFEDQPPLPITINRYEQQELAQHLTNARQLLGWLAPKLNGRAMLVEFLLDWQQAWSEPENPLQENTLHAIQEQLADVLEQADSTFNLEIEINQLGNTPSKTTQTPANNDNDSGQKQDTNAPQQNKDKESNNGATEDHRTSRDNQPLDETAPRDMPNVGTDLTISLIGRFNAGKSALGNGLLGYQHFPVLEIRVQERERDFTLHKLTLRSLPGYGNEEPDEWLDKNTIDPKEMVLLVMPDEFSELDADVLKVLIARNHPPERIIHVRNRFGDTLKTRLNRGEPIKEGTPEALACEKELKDEFQQSHKKNLEGNDIPEAYQCPLLFTTAKDIFNLKGGEELLSEIRSRLTSPDERFEFDFFACLRPALLYEEVESKIHSLLRQRVQSAKTISFIEIIEALSNWLGFDYMEYPEWLKANFNMLFERNFDKDVRSIQTRWRLSWEGLKREILPIIVAGANQSYSLMWGVAERIYKQTASPSSPPLLYPSLLPQSIESIDTALAAILQDLGVNYDSVPQFKMEQLKQDMPPLLDKIEQNYRKNAKDLTNALTRFLVLQHGERWYADISKQLQSRTVEQANAQDLFFLMVPYMAGAMDNPDVMTFIFRDSHIDVNKAGKGGGPCCIMQHFMEI